MESDSEDKRSWLLSLRLDTENLVKEWDSMPFKAKEILLPSYLYFLIVNAGCIHTDVNDVTADLNILQDLKPLMECDMADARRNYIEDEIASLYAQKKVAMMLQKLDIIVTEGSISIPDAFRKWIQEKLATTDWKELLDNGIYDALLPEEEEEFADQIIRVEQLDVEVDVEKENPDDIKMRLMGYLEEAKAVNERPQTQRNADCYFGGQTVFRLIERVICELGNTLKELNIKKGRPKGTKKKMKIGPRIPNFESLSYN